VNSKRLGSKFYELWFGLQGTGYRVTGTRFRVKDLGLMVNVFGFKVCSLRFEV
jgi:hypothetical protein